MEKHKNRKTMKRKTGRLQGHCSSAAADVASGFTLIEVMISILIVMVLATGVMGYQYRSSYDVKLSEIQAGAARISMMLLEGWKGDAGSLHFNPVWTFTEIEMNYSFFGPQAPDDGSGNKLKVLGHYQVKLEDAYYYVTLSWVEATGWEPRVLNATTAWRRDYTRGFLTGDESFVRYSTFSVDY